METFAELVDKTLRSFGRTKFEFPSPDFVIVKKGSEEERRLTEPNGWAANVVSPSEEIPDDTSDP